MPERHHDNPPQLTTAASLVAVQGALLILLAAVALLNIVSERLSLGLATSVFFLAYGGGLLWCAWGLVHRQGWARGPVLLTQLIQLGLAWNLRDLVLIAVLMVVVAVVVLAGMLSPASIEALSGDSGAGEGGGATGRFPG